AAPKRFEQERLAGDSVDVVHRPKLRLHGVRPVRQGCDGCAGCWSSQCPRIRPFVYVQPMSPEPRLKGLRVAYAAFEPFPNAKGSGTRMARLLEALAGAGAEITLFTLPGRH